MDERPNLQRGLQHDLDRFRHVLSVARRKEAEWRKEVDNALDGIQSIKRLAYTTGVTLK